MKKTVLVLFVGAVSACVLFSTGCGGGGSQNSNPPPLPSVAAFTVGGNISGLVSGSATLQNNNDQLQVSSDGSFTFRNKVPQGAAYDVLVAAQPSAQTCAVTSAASGIVTQDISNVAVDCAITAPNTWTFISGSTLANQSVAGTPDPREGAMAWTDSSDNLFLFGGTNSIASGGTVFSDFWEWSGGRWISVVGSGPSARLAAATWNDGSFQLFGGQSAAGSGPDVLGDSWSFSLNQWSLASPTGSPTARTASGFARASDGSVYIFGGQGLSTSGQEGMLSDLWKYSNGTWSLISGQTLLSQKAVYGTTGSASPDNIPGPRIYPVCWVDAAGNFWVFSGEGIDSNNSLQFLNDLWMYDTTANQWTWEGGSSVGGAAGVYGSQGISDLNNWPGGRTQAAHWIDQAGNVFIFGGIGFAANGAGNLNDLWKRDATTGQWVWLAGANKANQSGVYTGLASPGSRYNSATWIDSQGNLWLFGGNSFDSNGKVGWMGDLWEYTQ